MRNGNMRGALLLAGALLIVNTAFAQKTIRAAIGRQQPLAGQACGAKPDTSLFTTKKIYVETGDTSAAMWMENLVYRLEKYLLKCRGGREFSQRAIGSKTMFFKKYGMNEWGFLSEVPSTGNAECSNMTSIYFTVAKKLGLGPRVAFAEKHVFLIIGDWCVSIERNEHFPLADIDRHYKTFYITYPNDEKPLMAMPYTDLGQQAWAQGKAFENAGDSVSALAKFKEAAEYAQKAIRACPEVPKPYYNLSLYCSKFDGEASEAAYAKYRMIISAQNGSGKASTMNLP